MSTYGTHVEPLTKWITKGLHDGDPDEFHERMREQIGSANRLYDTLEAAPAQELIDHFEDSVRLFAALPDALALRLRGIRSREPEMGKFWDLVDHHDPLGLHIAYRTLLESDAMTPSDETRHPERYEVEPDNVEYLVGVIIDAAAPRIRAKFQDTISAAIPNMPIPGDIDVEEAAIIRQRLSELVNAVPIYHGGYLHPRKRV